MRNKREALMRSASRGLAAALIATMLGLPAHAQRGRQPRPSQVPRYTPATPTVSPYVTLLNRNNSAAANYYGLVRPLERQQAINQQQQQLSNYNERQIQGLRNQQDAFSQPDVRPTGTAGWFQQQLDINRGSGFQVPGHFFGQWQTGAGPQRRNVGGR
jgi:hypothetical protein